MHVCVHLRTCALSTHTCVGIDVYKTACSCKEITLQFLHFRIQIMWQ